eukprot:m.62706 g.62706  ORF g.62706 m.62706 type:complete len:227 (+) comp11413_c0_seq3:218-898(+)
MKVLQLGLVSWRRATALQQHLLKQIAANETKDEYLLLCQHPPTFTGGKRISFSEIEIERLEDKGAVVEHSKRGGEVTFHGPGQLVVYPICNVRRHGGIRKYVDKLEQTIIDTCACFGVPSNRSEHVGVWVGDGKIAAIGVQVTHGITRHGFALNCNTDLSWFDYIVPCGITDKYVTSLSKETHTDVSVDEVVPVVLSSFQSNFPRVTSLDIESMDEQSRQILEEVE